MPPPANLSGLSCAELEAWFVELLGALSERNQMWAAQRNESKRCARPTLLIRSDL